MAATQRQEREMRNKYEYLKHNPNLDPLTRMRAHLLSQGTNSLKDLHR